MDKLLIKHHFCCEEMYKNIQNRVISYDPIDRTYGMDFGKRSISLIKYCPWCNSEIPSRLHIELLTTLQNECGIDIPDLTNFTNVPEEFKSDAWWIKRNL